MKPQHTWKAEWTGHYPCYCHGTWKLYKDEEPVDLKEAGCPFINEEAGTYNNYSQWSFDENYCEVWYERTSGLGKKKWIQKNATWLRNLNTPYDWGKIYDAFREHDWIHGCCGGCI